jgi:hypothetical protein
MILFFFEDYIDVFCCYLQYFQSCLQGESSLRIDHDCEYTILFITTHSNKPVEC